MTCLATSQVSRFVPQRGFFSGQAGWPSLVQSALLPLKSWTGESLLPAGQALTMRAREAGELRIMQGRVWITFSHAGRDLRVPAGDHFCGAGESLQLSAGDAVVMESWGKGRAGPASFSWEPVAAPSFVAGVREPLRALRLALGLAAGAAARLLRALVQGAAVALGTGMKKIAAIF